MNCFSIHLDNIQLENEFEVVSPNGFPNPYPNNAYSFWDIRAPSGYVIEVHIDSFDVQGGADFIHIGDGVEHYSNDSTGDSRWKHLAGKKHDVHQYQDLESSSASIIIIFVSDWSIKDYGFIIQCSAKKIPPTHEGTSMTGICDFLSYSHAICLSLINM